MAIFSRRQLRCKVQHKLSGVSLPLRNLKLFEALFTTESYWAEPAGISYKLLIAYRTLLGSLRCARKQIKLEVPGLKPENETNKKGHTLQERNCEWQRDGIRSTSGKWRCSDCEGATTSWR